MFLRPTRTRPKLRQKQRNLQKVPTNQLPLKAPTNQSPPKMPTRKRRNQQSTKRAKRKLSIKNLSPSSTKLWAIRNSLSQGKEHQKKAKGTYSNCIQQFHRTVRIWDITKKCMKSKQKVQISEKSVWKPQFFGNQRYWVSEI